MKRLLAVIACIIASLSFGFAQSSAIQTGFAVVTPVEGSGQGLSVSEVFSQQVGFDVFRASVLPSPLVTLTSLVVKTDPRFAADTGIAIVNPNPTPTLIVLTLNNNVGLTIGATRFTIRSGEQIGRFVTELLPGVPQLSEPFDGLLFISSDVPVGVMGLQFVGPSFTSLPVTEQLTTNAPVIGTTATVGNTPQGQVQSVASLQTSPFIATAPVFANAPIITTRPILSQGAVIPTPLPTEPSPFIPNVVLPMPSTFPVILPPAPAVTPVVTVGGVAVPVGATTGIINPLTPTSTITAGTITTTTGPVVTTVVVTPLPEIALGIGGRLAQLLPQVATGGGWATVISIANNTTDGQFVRVDFFNADGTPMVLPFGSSVTRLFVPAGGVAAVSTLSE
jgi:hypothetical protein